jgi:hypothetical protein
LEIAPGRSRIEVVGPILSLVPFLSARITLQARFSPVSVLMAALTLPVLPLPMVLPSCQTRDWGLRRENTSELIEGFRLCFGCIHCYIIIENKQLHLTEFAINKVRVNQ